ncbi:MAG: prepilin-type N-terminal cleavage/methylation domain-containing protein [Verrucomicrobiota bacterium]
MKTAAQCSKRRRVSNGFTLLEMSAAMAVLLILSTALLGMLQQHILLMQLCQRQSFLTSEAPKIGNLLTRILNGVDHYFVYATKDAALGTGTPIIGSGAAVKLFFKSAAQTTETRVLAVEAGSLGAVLKLYTPQSSGTPTSWTVSGKIASAEFLSADGILGVTLHGPNGEQVTYSGGAR